MNFFFFIDFVIENEFPPLADSFLRVHRNHHLWSTEAPQSSHLKSSKRGSHQLLVTIHFSSIDEASSEKDAISF